MAPRKSITRRGEVLNFSKAGRREINTGNFYARCNIPRVNIQAKCNELT
ncbi:hypothetical protein HMPREF7215_0789 [Pyramidobacter piscolens W5455]|uniref:50S ribosomal protein L28 n=1 Tax=Pyramidobacter piscolens W5455 TaxID=352165 RepID=A0ABM9ZRE8_9BACT|nr:hypothetical protein HMPREF7215_0789 [Pyramidobacter piscolens W5455]